ncbi:Uncharacterised protein [Mycobacterium tuberculosis]|uniref:Uncharacterized protein n=1 Tax=Mycobacterium tuberculosis TaxID=1773 RepID=A0A654U901_MYCTX|nr:Uncharacterised protein [Mycobacterium tuberculosis]
MVLGDVEQSGVVCLGPTKSVTRNERTGQTGHSHALPITRSSGTTSSSKS